MHSGIAALAAGLAFFATGAIARASMTYPGLIAPDLGVSCPPPDCTICHENNNGGTGTVRKPFGRALLTNYGLAGGSNAASLQSALGTAQAQGLDANGDGFPDIDALKACKDPNVVAQPPPSADGGAVATPVLPPADPVPEYGCTVGRLPAPRGGAAGAIAVPLAMLAWGRRRFGARRGPRRSRGALDA